MWPLKSPWKIVAVFCMNPESYLKVQPKKFHCIPFYYWNETEIRVLWKLLILVKVFVLSLLKHWLLTIERDNESFFSTVVKWLTLLLFPIHRGSTVSANKALELVRAALQPSLNAEIESVLKSYQEVCLTNAADVNREIRRQPIMSQLKWPIRSISRVEYWCDTLTLTLKMTPAQVVKTSVAINNSHIQDCTHPDDHIPPSYEIMRRFKPFKVDRLFLNLPDVSHGCT